MPDRRIYLMALFACACSTSHPVTTDPEPPRPVDAGTAPRPIDDDGGEPPDDGGLPLETPDAGRPAPDASPPEADAGPIRRGTVACGDTPCAVPTHACRATCRVDGDPAPTCVESGEGWESGECPTEEETFPIVIARCDGPEDCGAGETCLVLFGSIGSYPQCMCQDDGEGGCAPSWSTPLCHTLADCPSWASACEPATTPLTDLYRTCVE